MVLLTEGDFVWIPSPSDATVSTPIGAEVIDVTNAKGIQVIDDEDRRLFLTPDVLIRLMHPKSILGVEDLTELEDIHEAGILRNLLVRFKQDLIYTYCGDCLISLNPYKNLDIYNPSFMKCYRNRRIGELEPHIYAIAEAAHKNLFATRCDQSIVISGESGAGKTESCKHIIKYLMVNNNSQVEEQILMSNPLIEAFGNAKTLNNENSSRFAKFIQLYFNEYGAIEGAEITQYLLEKSRVISHSTEDTNFHIFYFMLNGMSPDAKKTLHLTRTDDYFLLSQGNTAEMEKQEAEYNVIINCFKKLGFEAAVVHQIFQLLSAILNLGNLDYQTKVTRNVETTELADPEQVTVVSELLNVDEAELSKVLTATSMTIRSETVTRNLTAQQAIDSRDSLIKNLYAYIFQFLLKQINVVLQPASDAKTFKKLDILNIFGFENLKQNRFEQFCINYANEVLEQLYVRHMFKLERLEYEAQKIAWSPQTFDDNVAVLDLLANGPLSLMSLINEETIFPQGTDHSLLLKMHHTHAASELYVQPKSDLSRCFAVKHYAATVFYNTHGFIDKNKDTLSPDIKSLLASSSCTLLSNIMKEFDTTTTAKQTVTTTFKRSLDSLMLHLDNTTPYFVRCIKPNAGQQKDMFNRSYVLRQLRYTGMLDLVVTRNAGYPVRLPYNKFVDTFRGLLPGIRPSRRENCIEATSRILTVILGEEADFQLGRTKVFMKQNDYTYMENERHKMLTFYVASIQKHLKGWIQRRRYKAQKLAAVTIQKHWRGFVQRSNYHKILNGIVRLQSILRSHQLVFRFTLLTECTTRLQALCRGYLARQRFQTLKLQPQNRGPEKIPEDPIVKSTVPSRCHDETNFSFEKFAVANFLKADSKFLKEDLRYPLLQHMTTIDNVCSHVLWKQILRYAEDLPESAVESNKGQQNIIDITYQVLNSTELIMNDDYCNEGYPNYFDRKFNNNERIQVIISHGILRPELRDEIYCQIIKQINGNNTPSSSKYWQLLALVSSSFQPSESLLPYLNDFISQFASMSPAYPTIHNHIAKCYSKGTRLQPISSCELSSIRSYKQILLPITFCDGSTHQFIVDSYTTAQELCSQIMTMLGLKDKFGFSLYLSLNETASSLGASSDFIFDAITVCEREGIKKGHQYDNIPWRLFYRKEIFSPWHQNVDTVASDLIYEQIVRGLRYGEYQCSNENEIVLLATQQYYVINNGDEIDVNKLESVLSNILPISTTKSEQFHTEPWIQKIMNTYRKAYMLSNFTSNDVKSQIIDFARIKWASAFSRLFKAQKINSLGIPDEMVVIAINSEVVNVVDYKNEVKCEITYDEIENIVVNQHLNSNVINIQTVDDDEFKFQTKNAVNIKELIIFFINGMKKRSKYMVALESIENRKFLSCEMGDVLYMENPEQRKNAVLVECVNTKVNEKGIVPLNKMRILATLRVPSQKLVQHYKQQNQFRSKPTDDINKEQTVILFDNCSLKLVHVVKSHTLHDFATTHFVSTSDVLVKYNGIPINEPLLKTSRVSDEIRKMAIKMYLDVMRFMGDLPWSQSIHSLVDAIFTGPVKNEILRDELYCQIVKQITDNPNPASEQHGWKLMWLALGLFSPSKELNKEIDQVFRSKQTAKSRECLLRLSKITSVYQPRKCPPHYVEVDSVLANRTEIFHKFHLPDGSGEIIQIESTDQCHHICEKIAKAKNMKSKGCAVFVKINEKVMSLPEKDYIFDYLRMLGELMKPTEPRTLTYKLLMMKKIWTHVNPGEDVNGDLVLHFPQELPKYLRGYYDVPEEDITRLAALILRAKTNEDSEIPLKHIPTVLNEILPRDVVKKHSSSEWKKAISKECLKLPKMSHDDAKVAFLKVLYKLPTFGSAFFEVKQTSDPSIPAKINLSINKTGVSVFNPETKCIIVQYPYNGIVNWTAGNTYFHMTTGNMIKGGRLLVETTLGYKIDDLLSSYIQTICDTTITKRQTA
ncbi:unnamed protein product [Bursaphelenchus okinawaensis]|uniref:Uncharacterized protein n=1 Tax=Bursaphelenchus okinawaensis TaxID=465554 RepID=A0A811LNK4_9BILA|nr:unnamed protein product [Bursaphelenchus okinawaensis]CAG9126139.1 unnamed protein product [Bursaphelenchus okinawaensis]